MSYPEVEQLYNDIAQQANRQPSNIVPAYNVALYNNNLEEAKSDHPAKVTLQRLPEIKWEVSYGDFLAVIGQLMRILKEIQDGEAMEAYLQHLDSHSRRRSPWDEW